MNSLQKQPPEVLLKKGVLKNFRKFTAKHLHRILFFKKVTGLRLAILSKKRFQFSYESYEISKNNFLQSTSGGLLLP